MKKLRRYTIYILLLGIILLTAGLVAGAIGEQWSPLVILLIVIGTAIVCGGLYLALENSKFWQQRSTQVGTNALVATTAVLAILISINFVAVRYSLRLDLTENQIFTLSPQSQEIVANLKQPLKVWLFVRKPNQEDRELLENYSRYNSQFEFEFVDPNINITQAENFKIKEIGEIYLEYGEKKQLIQTLKLNENLTESKLTNEIAKIQRDRSFSLYFLQGHGEPALDTSEGGLMQAVSSLKESGYTVESFNLATSSQIPKNTDVIVIASPKRPLLIGEVKAIQEYLKAGGKLMLMLNANINPGLETILKDWGIQLDDRLLIDASGTGRILGLGPATTIVTNYGNHPITKDFRNGISLYPLARGITTTGVTGVVAEPILITSAQTWAESDVNSEQLTFDLETDILGPINLAVALTRNDAESGTESRLIVVGNSTFATNGWFKQQLNGDFFLNSVSWLVNEDDSSLSIRPREAVDRRLNLTPLQGRILFWLAIVIMPLIGLIGAGVTWWRRR